MGAGEKNRRDQEFFRGCLLGGAVGDALGYAVEFDKLNGIKAKYGPRGINKLPKPALISDDTQMTMFTAEGLLRISSRWHDRGICGRISGKRRMAGQVPGVVGGLCRFWSYL